MFSRTAVSCIAFGLFVEVAAACGSSGGDGAQTCAGRACPPSLDGGATSDGPTQGGEGGSGACAAHTADCDGNPANGCETHVDTDGKNCSACGHDCLGGTCVAGSCKSFELHTVPSGSNQIVTPTAARLRDRRDQRVLD